MCVCVCVCVCRVAYRIYLWGGGGGGGGGTHISAASRGLVACSPRKFLYSTLDSGLILGGEETQAGGGKSQCAPPPLCMQSWCVCVCVCVCV